jgi:hypothetical protein
MFGQHNQSKEVEGELEISGHGSVAIRLEREPREVKVRFIDDCAIISCNPHHMDELSSQIDRQKTRHGHNLVLNIHWRVQGSRKIAWLVIY